jgi:transcription antitermination factor NusG
VNHRWYAVQTTSGHENKVRMLVQRKIDADRPAEERAIRQALVPTEQVVEIKNGKKVTVERKVFPGYVLVEMALGEETLHTINAIQGVIKFVGQGSRPAAAASRGSQAAAGHRGGGGGRPSRRRRFRSSSGRPWRSRTARSRISTGRSRK